MPGFKITSVGAFFILGYFESIKAAEDGVKNYCTALSTSFPQAHSCKAGKLFGKRCKLLLSYYFKINNINTTALKIKLIIINLLLSWRFFQGKENSEKHWYDVQ